MAFFPFAYHSSADVQHTTQYLLLLPLPDRALAIALSSHLHPKGGGIPSHPSSYQQLQIQLAERLVRPRRL